MLKHPIVSIVVPVYNVEQYLEQCLDSLVNQTLSEIEIICVNDGSTDRCGEILKRYQEKDLRIIVVEQKNQGLSGARNMGMQYAQGKYIMFVDSDDWIDVDTCKNVVEVAEDKQADLVFWSYIREFEDVSKEKLLFWEDGKLFEKEQVKNQLQRRICGLLGEELSRPDYANAFETAWGKLYLTERLLNNKILFVDTKEIGTEDALFNLYALEHIERAVYVKRCFSHYRKTNQGSLTSNYKCQLFAQWKNLFDKMEQYIEQNKLSQDYYDALDNRRALSLLGLGLNVMSAEFSFIKKRKLIRDILHDERYQNAYKKLEFKYLPVRWKIFYGCAKHKFGGGVCVLLLIITKFISR